MTPPETTGGILPGLKIEGLSFSFRRREPVLHALDLVVPRGQVHGVLGTSGSGKTSLLRLIAGLERPTGGTITIEDDVVESSDRHVPPERRGVGMVFQDFALFPNKTVRQNVGYGLPRGPRRDRRRLVEDLLARVGVPELAGRLPHTLSGGQQQRVAIARALARQPRVMLDEPFSSLDSATREDTRAETMAVLRASAVTTVIVTHDPEEANALADQVTRLDSPEDPSTIVRS